MLVSSPSQPILASDAQSRVCRGRTLQLSHMELHPESTRACRSISCLVRHLTSVRFLVHSTGAAPCSTAATPGGYLQADK